MDVAYDKWQETKGWSYRQFLSSLDARERKAVVRGNFNSQVLNGGLCQWVENGYASGSGRELLDLLADIGTPLARRVRGIVVSVLVHVDLTVEKGGCFDNYWVDDPEEFLEELDELTNDYFELSDGFESEVEDFLRGSVSV
jgi:hypothetical protein